MHVEASPLQRFRSLICLKKNAKNAQKCDKTSENRAQTCADFEKGRIGSTLRMIGKIWNLSCAIAGMLHNQRACWILLVRWHPHLPRPARFTHHPQREFSNNLTESNTNQVKKLDTLRGVCYSSKGVKFFDYVGNIVPIFPE